MSKLICRLCLNPTTICFSLLEDPISAMLETLTNIKVSGEDLVRPVACSKCYVNLKLAYNIQQKFLKCTEKVSEFANFIKVEIEESPVSVDEFIPPSCCTICGKSLLTEHSYKHIQEHFAQEQSCDLCTKVCENVSKYKEHCLEEHQNETTNNRTCVKCGVTFRYGCLYEIHKKQAHNKIKTKHSNIDANALEAMAHLGVTSKRALEVLTVKTPENENYVCMECNKTFPNKYRFQKHSHEKKPCHICNALISISNLSKHVLLHTAPQQICEICGSTLKNKDSLRAHLLYIHNKNPLKCTECAQQFKSPFALKFHMRKHTGEKNHICEICGKGFYSKHYMEKHVKLRHLKERNHICEFCKKAYSTRHALVTHARQHTNETPYRCEVCGEGFRQNISLRTHRKSKHGIEEERNILCKVCGKGFISEHAVKSHMRLH